MTNLVTNETPALPARMQEENSAIVRQILQFTVTDAESYVLADDWGRKLKNRIKKIDELCEPFISAAKRAKAAAEEARKEAVLFRDRAVEELERGEQHLNKQVSAYRAELQRKQREAQEAADRVERERVAAQRALEAEEARARGREKLAQTIEAAPIEVHAPPVVNPDLPRTGSALRIYYKFRITDASAVPRNFCCPDEKAIGEYVRREKEKAIGAIPGIEVYADERTSW